MGELLKLWGRLGDGFFEDEVSRRVFEDTNERRFNQRPVRQLARKAVAAKKVITGDRLIMAGEARHQFPARSIAGPVAVIDNSVLLAPIFDDMRGPCLEATRTAQRWMTIGKTRPIEEEFRERVRALTRSGFPRDDESWKEMDSLIYHAEPLDDVPIENERKVGSYSPDPEDQMLMVALVKALESTNGDAYLVTRDGPILQARPQIPFGDKIYHPVEFLGR